METQSWGKCFIQVHSQVISNSVGKCRCIKHLTLALRRWMVYTSSLVHLFELRKGYQYWKYSEHSRRGRDECLPKQSILTIKGTSTSQTKKTRDHLGKTPILAWMIICSVLRKVVMPIEIHWQSNNRPLSLLTIAQVVVRKIMRSWKTHHLLIFPSRIIKVTTNFTTTPI